MESPITAHTNRKGGIVAGGMLVLFGGLSLAGSYTDIGFYLWVGILLAGVIGLVLLWSTDRKQQWILLPAYALTAVAGIIAIIEFEILDGSEISGLVFGLVALPFIASFLMQPVKRWGLLIPAYMVAANGLLVFLVGKNWLSGPLVAAYVMGAIALPFWLIVIRDPDQWWAAVPAGIVTLLSMAFVLQANHILGRVFPLAWPTLLIAGGAWLILGRFMRDRLPEDGDPLEASGSD